MQDQAGTTLEIGGWGVYNPGVLPVTTDNSYASQDTWAIAKAAYPEVH